MYPLFRSVLLAGLLQATVESLAAQAVQLVLQVSESQEARQVPGVSAQQGELLEARSVEALQAEPVGAQQAELVEVLQPASLEVPQAAQPEELPILLTSWPTVFHQRRLRLWLCFLEPVEESYRPACRADFSSIRVIFSTP